MKKLLSLIALVLMIATPALAGWRGGVGFGVGVGGPGWGVGVGSPGYYGGWGYGGWGYPGWYGGWGYPGWGYDPDPVATEEARQMRSERKERERAAREQRKAQRRGYYTPRTKSQIAAEKRRLDEEYKQAPDDNR